MIQYETTSTIPQQIRDIVANRCSLLDQYILVQTGEYEYTALILDIVTDDCRQLVFTRASNYGSYYVVESDGSWEYFISNEYYCYSNVGIGAALDLPVIEGVQAHASVIFTVVLMFLLVFRTSMFPFYRKKK